LPIRQIWEKALLVRDEDAEMALKDVLRHLVSADTSLSPDSKEISVIVETLMGASMAIEESPIKGASLKDLAAWAKKNPVGLGAVVGFLAVGFSPLLLITVPAGMILVGAAASVADAIQKGLPQVIMRQLGVKQEVLALPPPRPKSSNPPDVA
jgi:hypothetical protein